MRLITLLFSTLAFTIKADMDYICSVDDSAEFGFGIHWQIENTCERNNILSISDIRDFEGETINRDYFVEAFCRFDREIILGKNEVSCVLYSKQPRKIKEQRVANLSKDEIDAANNQRLCFYELAPGDVFEALIEKLPLTSNCPANIRYKYQEE